MLAAAPLSKDQAAEARRLLCADHEAQIRDTRRKEWDDQSITLDGKELAAHRTLGTHDGQDVVGEMYCADVAGEVVQIVVETHGATELSPEIQGILDSWVWVED